MEPVTPPATAAPAASTIPDPTTSAAPATHSAERDAANTGDFSAFDSAHTASRSGKPLADVAATPDPAAATPPAADGRPVSKRQQQINDYERNLAESRQRIGALEAELHAARTKAAPAQPPEPAHVPAPAPATDLEPDPADTTKYPDGQFDRKYLKDQSRWEARQEMNDRDQQAHARAEASRRHDAESARFVKFSEGLDAAKQADPAFFESVAPEVKALRPLAALAPGEKPGPLNALAEELLDSPAAPQIMRHLTAHPETLDAFRTCRSPREVLARFARLEAQFDAPAAAATPAPHPQTITAAPPPAPTLTGSGASSDPKAAALARGDFATFDNLDMAERKARRTSAA